MKLNLDNVKVWHNHARGGIKTMAELQFARFINLQIGIQDQLKEGYNDTLGITQRHTRSAFTVPRRITNLSQEQGW